MSEVASSEQENSVLSPPSGFKLRYTLKGHRNIITQIAWSADGKKLASASKDHTIQLWNTETGERMSVLEGHTDTVFGIAWSPDGEVLVSVSADNTIKIWNTNTGNLRSVIENEKSNAIAWCPSGKMFASRNSDYYKILGGTQLETIMEKELKKFSTTIELRGAQTENKIEDLQEKIKKFSRKIEFTSNKIANLFSDNKVTKPDRETFLVYAGNSESLQFISSNDINNNNINIILKTNSYKRQFFGELLDELLEKKD